MMTVNFESDFDFRYKLIDEAGNSTPWPKVEFRAVFWTVSKMNCYEASYKGGKYTNCIVEDGDLHFVFDNHRLAPGRLHMKLYTELPNEIYGDLKQRISEPVDLDIELIRGKGNTPTNFAVEEIPTYLMPTWQDMPNDLVTSLRRPAEEAGERADIAAQRANAAAERTENAIGNANTAAASAQSVTTTALEVIESVSTLEAKLIKRTAEVEVAETARAEAEQERKQSETERKDAEQTREANESGRIVAEHDRQGVETERRESETLRAASETERVQAEAGRAEAESGRVTAEMARVEAEADRQTAHSARMAEAQTATQQASEAAQNANKTAEDYAQTLAGKQNNLVDSTDISISGTELEITERGKQKLFDDMWLKTTSGYGEVDHTHMEGNTLKPYFVNDVWLTYNEAMVHLPYFEGGLLHKEQMYSRSGLKTISVHHAVEETVSYANILANSPSYITLRIITEAGEASWCDNMYMAFHNCSGLRAIYGKVDILKCSNFGFVNCRALEEFRFNRLNASINLQWSPKINLDTWKYLVVNAYGTAKRTITVHPDIYAKLTDEENAEWHKVLTDALAKNISFATV